MIINEHIASLGFRLSYIEDIERLVPLLKACHIDVVMGEDTREWSASTYIGACTAAGGIAASVGWAYQGDIAVLHSLAVGPSTRGCGIGASQLAMAMALIKEEHDVNAIYISTSSARDFFASFGFIAVDSAEVPQNVRNHWSFQRSARTTFMVRQYRRKKHGIDQCAFQLIHNTTADATLPPGSVFLFKQSGQVLESNYRGGPVTRGHLLGAFDGEHLNFRWHHCIESGDLFAGGGQIRVSILSDGRRELREKLGDDPGELLLREV